MIIKTRIYELARGKYENLSGLARAMGLSVSQVYRVREGKRGINEKFIIGAKLAFPDCRLDELFYFHADSPAESRPEPVNARTFSAAGL
jgi:methyl coenzyme M reductase subunit C-like uncharacterized protein (methanogenesis marker protein 7)